MKKYIFLVIAFLSLFTILSSGAFARDYWLDGAFIKGEVYENGVFHVEESIKYSFSGDFTEVYRQVFNPDGGEIKNLSGYCENDLCRFEIRIIPNGYELAGVMIKPTPEEVVFHISYDYYGGVKVYNDVSELHYKVWGDEWEKPVKSITAEFVFPSKINKTYTHPEGFTLNESINNNIYSLKTIEIPRNQYYEIRVIFPRLENAIYAKNIDESATEQIERIERLYLIQKKLSYIMLTLVIILFILFIAFPVFIYYKFGKEPEVNYISLYEREPPTKTKPAIVNSIMRGVSGQPSIDAFTATIMDLVYKKYIELTDIKTTKKSIFGKKVIDDVELRLANRPETNLESYEKKVLSLLRKHAENKRVIWSEFQKELGKDTEFYKYFSAWARDVKEHAKFESVFNSKGNKYLVIFSIIVFVLSFFINLFIYLFFPPHNFPIMFFAISLIFIMRWGSFALLLIAIFAYKVFGRFTPEGYLFYRRWKNFRNYLTDFSLLKEHPPESIKLWDYYMVYAVALGVADKVKKNMEMILPKSQIERTNIHYLPVISSGFRAAYASSSPSSRGSSGVGGAGGGFGGGGGGAR